jgi:geranylgeranyl pyrophosphate synthase
MSVSLIRLSKESRREVWSGWAMPFCLTAPNALSEERGQSAVTVVAEILASRDVGEYLETLEAHLAEAVARDGGVVAEVGAEALAAGGKRLRPLLVFLTTSPDDEPPIAAGVAVELVHMASLVHDDLIDGAEFRRGRASAWARYGPAAARAAGDYLFARAFAELAATGDERALAVLAEACLCLARGEAMQRTQSRDPETTVGEYLERCALKTGKLFEAACVLGGGDRGLAPFGLALGIAFQIADDILDCTGDALETGKVGGTDLREGTPTLPLLLAARRDACVRSALLGGPLDGVLVRVAESGALERSRRLADRYARRARTALEGHPRRGELTALTYAVVDRQG